MFRSPFRSLSLALTLAVGTVACNSSNPFNPVTPTPTDPVTVTYSGTVTRNGGATHTFRASFPGDVTAAITALDPEDATVGLSLGAWNGTSCPVVPAADEATPNPALLGVATTTGDLCARIYDAGQLSGPAAYTITVVHP